MENLKQLKNDVEKALKSSSILEEIEDIRREYLGRKGKLTIQLRGLKNKTEQERKKYGKKLNEFKKELGIIFDEKMTELKNSDFAKRIEEEWIDVTRPAYKKSWGALHPITKTIQDVEDIFFGMGFESIHGPQIETEWYNFEALNIPPNHPARDLWDTFWLKDGYKPSVISHKRSSNERLLLRTHTSPVQIRYMEQNKPPFRIIVPGRVFRYEATDASHETQFYQLEGLMVADNISVASFRAIIEEFFKQFFKQNVKVRLRPSYFPFVEPGFEVDISCITCNGKGCSVCSQTGWLELMGAGMVHPNVFKSAGYNPKNLTGFAFGVGIDRLAMMKYKIDDIRLFYGGDLRFLRQFK